MSDKYISIVPLTGANFPTWKVQCQMALVKDGLWGIVNGSETVPEDASPERRSKFETRKDRALATVMLSIDPSLLYLIGDPEIQSPYGQRYPTSSRRKPGPIA